METICQETPTLLLDMKVTIHNTSMVFPSKQTEKKSLFLSNIDKVLKFDVKTVHFFEANNDFPPEIVTDKLKKALEDVLVAYDFLAGRLMKNSETNRLEINCNAEGVGFVVASSEYTLDQIGDLAYPNQAFAQFVHKTKDFLKIGDIPLCVVQVTSFQCGAFVIGITTSHACFDGLSFKTFLENLALLASDMPLDITLCHNRQLLAARSPPHVSFPHPEMIKFDNITLRTKYSIFRSSLEELDFKVFHLNSKHINSLKEKAKCNDNNVHVTSFNVISAHLWRCKTLSGIYDPSKSSTILYAVDIRSKLNPPLPKSYIGNAVLTGYATTNCKELKEYEFSNLVEMVGEGSRRMNDEYVRSIIDWGELYNGFPNGEILVSSWWRLGFEKVEYPWGKPKYSCPVVYRSKDVILLFPPFHGSSEVGGGDGVNVIVSLPPKEMENFQRIFYTF